MISSSPDIEVVPYDPEWPRRFEHVCAVVWLHVKDQALRIDHVGSTAVPGLAAKPIIDMDVAAADEDHVEAVKELLAPIGYRWIGDLGVVGRQAFRPPRLADLPAHNLYLVVENNKAHLDHLLLQDLLRADETASHRYAAMKRSNAKASRGDLTVYTARKAAMVAELLSRARCEQGLPAAEYWVPTSDELDPPS